MLAKTPSSENVAAARSLFDLTGDAKSLAKKVAAKKGSGKKR